jgi:hypothetical protein
MTLDDLLPDDKEVSSSASQQGTTSSSSKQKTSDEEEYAKIIGSPPNEKKFTEEKWEQVRRVIVEEFGYSVNDVLNRPSSERYEIIHEAAVFPTDELDADESEHYEPRKCAICGSAYTEQALSIEGKVFCPHHTVGQLRQELDT